MMKLLIGFALSLFAFIHSASARELRSIESLCEGQLFENKTFQVRIELDELMLAYDHSRADGSPLDRRYLAKAKLELKGLTQDPLTLTEADAFYSEFISYKISDSRENGPADTLAFPTRRQLQSELKTKLFPTDRDILNAILRNTSVLKMHRSLTVYNLNVLIWNDSTKLVGLNIVDQFPVSPQLNPKSYDPPFFPVLKLKNLSGVEQRIRLNCQPPILKFISSLD